MRFVLRELLKPSLGKVPKGNSRVLRAVGSSRDVLATRSSNQESSVLVGNTFAEIAKFDGIGAFIVGK